MSKNISFVLIGFILSTVVVISNQFVDRIHSSNLFYFLFTSHFLIIVSCIYFLFQKKQIRLHFHAIDFLFLGYLLWSFFSTFIAQGINVYHHNDFIALTSLFICYVIIVNLTDTKSNIYAITSLLVCWSGVVVSIWALLQYVGVLTSYNQLFLLSGPFNNPGPLGIYLVATLPFALYECSSKRTYTYLYIAIIVFELVVITLTHSRTALIGAAFVLGIHLLLNSDSIKESITSHKKFLWPLLMLVPVFIFFLYRWKPQSVDGRIFIWKNTMDLIVHNPLIGYGFSMFETVYNEQQAAYFKENPDDLAHILLADTVGFAFNDYLQILTESGLIGFLLFIIPIALILRGAIQQWHFNKTLKPFVLSVLVILSMALTSYPMEVLPIHIVFMISLTLLRTSVKSMIFIRSRVIVLLLATIIGFHFPTIIRRVNGQWGWKEALVAIASGQKDVLNVYERIYPIMKHHPPFLYNYGAILIDFNQLDDAIRILHEAEKNHNKPNLYIHLGNSYALTERRKEAILAFEKAYYMMPAMFYPRYKLVELYDQTGQKELAKKMAYKTLQLPEKVPSNLTKEIKRLLQVYMQSNP